ncbi:zinc ribbon domain-containing protein [Candidatus Saganbacteria bacterium]|nr:zinc ribbon domain-containing protein [Candidatus Saganbacteria bacterium]
MLFYDYKCGRCGKTFEVSHGMSAKPQGIKCEFCKSTDIQRIFTPIRTIGSGGESSGGGSCSSCADGACSSCSCKG